MFINIEFIFPFVFIPNVFIFNPKTYFVHIYVSNRYVDFFIGYNLYWEKMEKDIEEYLYLKFHFLFEFLYAE